MSPELKKHLQKQQATALMVMTLGEAIETLISNNLGHHQVVANLSSSLVGLAAELNTALDSVNLNKVDVA
ncbi:hypothetical protein [Paracoccus sp. MC1862]|uniref:hypothetical protein n=1 Tax=Paracoccus sp. MC1862 TaxID=2760307 RepID=UPI00160028C9|nr:hypothetical protein [Paracoccus sp. MC1862]MBB1498791.1 hypothetical protein [Paracoccus sp. MC1862]QQO43803.1 hypothetical protein JGR78_10215 [Paracoccus sp. MC1862]